MNVSWADQKFKKNSLWSVIFSYSMQQQTISQLDCDMWRKVDCIQQPAVTSSVATLRSTSQCQTCTKKRSWVMVLVVCCLSDPLQLHGSHWNHYISEKYAQQIDEMHWKLQLALVNRKGFYLLSKKDRSTEILLHNNTQLHAAQPMLQMLSKLGYEVLLHPPYSPFSTDYFFKHLNNFLQGKCFHNQEEAENVFQVCQISKHGFLYYRNKQTDFLLAKMCWLQWFLFSLIKMCLSLDIMI